MRSLLAALLASVMLAGVVGAEPGRVAVVVPQQSTGFVSDAALLPEPNGAIARDVRLLREMLSFMNADPDSYVFVPAALFNTEAVRTGLLRWPNGTIEQFGGIIIPTYPGHYRTSGKNIYPNVAFDSLTRIARGGPLVPHLYLLTNATALRMEAGNYLSSSAAATRCSVGVAVGASKVNPDFGQALYLTDRPTHRWFPQVYTAGWPVSETNVPGGIRKLLQASCSGFAIHHHGGGLTQSQWPDSLPFYSASNETTLVWDRLWANLASCPTAKTMTFADYYGAGLVFDSLSNEGTPAYRNSDNEGDQSVLRFALAHFDSLLGRKLFNGEAAVRGIFVADANSRGLRRWTGGIAPSDTAAYYSSLDSLAAWGVPITFGLNVNPDTLSARERDLIKLKSIGTARFTPYITDGVMDTAFASIGATGTTRNKVRWIDVFGRWRDRRYVSGGNCLCDTSLTSQLSYLRTFTDSITGRPTVRVLTPPYDDWSPGVKSATDRFIARTHSRAYADSFMYAAQQAGWLGVLANGQSRESDMSVSSGPGYTNPRGFIGRQGWYKPGICSDPFMVLTHNGTSPNLGRTQEFLFDDSTSAKSDGAIGYFAHTLDRANGGFWAEKWENMDEWRTYDSNTNANWYSKPWVGVVFPYDDMFYPPKRGFVLKLHAADLSGDPANPARMGLHVIRSLQQGFAATNIAAGRTLVRLGWLDEVRP